MAKFSVTTRTVAAYVRSLGAYNEAVAAAYFVDVNIDGVICSTSAASVAQAIALAERLGRALGLS